MKVTVETDQGVVCFETCGRPVELEASKVGPLPKAFVTGLRDDDSDVEVTNLNPGHSVKATTAREEMLERHLANAYAALAPFVKPLLQSCASLPLDPEANVTIEVTAIDARTAADLWARGPRSWQA